MSVALVNPRSFHEIIHRKRHNITVKFNHICLELDQEAGTIAPAHPRSTVIIDHYSRIDIIPPAPRSVIGHRIHDQRPPYRICVWTGRTVRHSHTDCLAVRITTLGRNIEIVFSIRSFYSLRSPGLTHGPAEICRFHHDSVISPGQHIIGRIAKPFSDIESILSFITRSVLKAFIVTAEYVETAVRCKHRSRIGGIAISYKRVSLIHKSLIFRALRTRQKQRANKRYDKKTSHNQYHLKVIQSISTQFP